MAVRLDGRATVCCDGPDDDRRISPARGLRETAFARLRQFHRLSATQRSKVLYQQIGKVKTFLHDHIFLRVA
jgi:hypothetical protein